MLFELKTNKYRYMNFNPIKETVDGKKAHDMVWSSNVLSIALQGLQKGKKLVANPFYENNTKLLKSDLVFERTPEELSEWFKCKDDIIYFANKYCKLMTPTGIRNVEMRDYQEEYLRHLENNRLSIFLSCRQSGKCVSPSQRVSLRVKDENILADRDWSKYRTEDSIYDVPLFEIIDLYRNDIIWKLKYICYKFIYKLENADNKNID